MSNLIYWVTLVFLFLLNYYPTEVLDVTDHHRKRGSLVVIISLRQLDSFVDTRVVFDHHDVID